MSKKAFGIAAVAGVLAIVGVLAFTQNNATSLVGFSEEETEFINFVARYRKNYYNREEYDYRLNIFSQNYRLIHEHNAGDFTYKLAINHLADIPEHEFKRNYLGLAAPNSNEAFAYKYLDTSNVDGSFDWQEQGKVTGVKNQGSCGSCWAFATIGAMESLYMISGHSQSLFSEQQLVDCSGSYGNQGCNGGWPHWAFQYIEAGNKLETESDYPYTARDGTCKYQSTKGVFEDARHEMVPQYDADQLVAAIAKNPVAVALNAGSATFQFYHSGVITGTSCGTQVNHAVLAVGYGTESGVDFYRIKNSWGGSWGDKGYVKVGRTSSNRAGVCGILQTNSYPRV